MKTSKTLLTVLLFAGSAFAQFPDAPSAVKKEHVLLAPFHDPYFWAGTGVHIAGVIVDVRFVQGCEQNHTCVEANPGADKFKNRIPELALGTLGRYGCSLMLKDHKYWRAVCLAPSVAVALYDIIDGTKIHQQ